jgi:hypothetical protein
MAHSSDVSTQPPGTPPVEPARLDDLETASRRSRRHGFRWVLGAMVLLLLAGAGLFVYRWLHSGAQALPTSVAIERYRHEAGTDPSDAGPPPGVYSYRGSGAETISVPPTSQSEGPGIPGTVVGLPGGASSLASTTRTATGRAGTTACALARS